MFRSWITGCCAIAAMAVLFRAPMLAVGEMAAIATIQGPATIIPYFSADRTFSFDILLEADFDAYSASFRVHALDESGPGNPSPVGVFQLTGVTFNEAAGWTTDTGLALPDKLESGAPGQAISQLISALPLGDYVSAGGPTRLMTVHGTVADGAVAGAYYFSLADIVVGNSDYNDVIGSYGGPSHKIEITPIPAPAALPLGVVGLALVGWFRKRLAVGGGQLMANSQ